MRRCPTSPRVARSVTARVSTEPRPPRAEPGRQSLRWVMPPTAPWAREAPRRVLVLFLLSLWDVCEARHCIPHTSDLPETMGWKPEEAAPPPSPQPALARARRAVPVRRQTRAALPRVTCIRTRRRSSPLFPSRWGAPCVLHLRASRIVWRYREDLGEICQSVEPTTLDMDGSAKHFESSQVIVAELSS